MVLALEFVSVATLVVTSHQGNSDNTNNLVVVALFGLENDLASQYFVALPLSVVALRYSS